MMDPDAPTSGPIAPEVRPGSLAGRIAALVLAVLGIPAVLGLSGFFTDAPIVVGEESPRTVIAPEEIRVANDAETERQQRIAEEAVDPVVDDDLGAQRALIQTVVDAFEVAADVRTPGIDGEVLSDAAKIEALGQRLTALDEDGYRAVVEATDAELNAARVEAVAIAQEAARDEIQEGEVDAYADSDLERAIALTAIDPTLATEVVEPLLRSALRPTITVDQAATEQLRAEAAASVEAVETRFPRGTTIVRTGEPVTEVQSLALAQAGLEGSDPLVEAGQALLLSVMLTAVVGYYLSQARPQIWASGRHLLLLGVLLVLFTAIAVGISTVQIGGTERFYLIPVGAIAMLGTILFDARVGVLSVIPMTAIVAYEIPATPGLVPFIAVAGLLSIPLVAGVSARGQLRTAAWQSTLAYVVLAGAFDLIYAGVDELGPALLYGLANGVLTAVMVSGLLPFLESLFGVMTSTSLLDFADRNHPLLRELEQKAIGTYNHSVMVATLASRACRAIAANALLAEVMALYHDIGKVQKPYFFVENQGSIQNPHDELDDPRQSALIIQRHVKDGVEMAITHKLPPEIVDGIKTHHGTTRVEYFYRQALARADDGLAPQPDEAFFRYSDGRKPFTREQAVLMLADCTEGAVRAASSKDGGMTSDEIRQIVTGLIGDRVADGQMDESPLSFADLRVVEGELITALEGVYHPRIQYPKDPRKTGEIAAQARKETEAEARAAEEADRRRQDSSDGSKASDRDGPDPDGPDGPDPDGASGEGPDGDPSDAQDPEAEDPDAEDGRAA